MPLSVGGANSLVVGLRSLLGGRRHPVMSVEGRRVDGSWDLAAQGRGIVRLAMPSVIPPARKHGGAPLASWRKEVAPTVIAMAAEMGPQELTARAVALRMGLQDAQIWRALPRGRSDILFLVAGELQVRQVEAVAHHDGLRMCTCRARVEAHLAGMLEFDFRPDVKPWRRACTAQSWYWTRDQYSRLWGRVEGPLEPIEKDLGAAVAVVWAVYESTFRDACVMEWSLQEATSKLAQRLLAAPRG